MRVSLERVGTDYIVRWESCDGATATGRLESIEVERVVETGSRLERETLCKLSSTAIDAYGGRSWTYGTSVPGTSLDKCDPLENGRQYGIAVMSALPGYDRFWVDAEGIRHIESLCHEH